MLQNPKVPIVFSSNFSRCPGVSARISILNFWEHAWRLLAERRCTRAAVIAIPTISPFVITEGAARYGVTCSRHLLRAADPYHLDWIRHNTKDILESSSQDRPDALVIGDDHLLGPVVELIAESGIRIPEDLLVISQWNFPLPYYGRIPIELLGFDATTFINAAVAWMRSKPTVSAKLDLYHRHQSAQGGQTATSKFCEKTFRELQKTHLDIPPDPFAGVFETDAKD